MQNLTIAAVQTTLHWESPDANISMLREKILASKPADVVLLPEMFTTGFSMNTSFAEPIDGPGQQFLKEMAQIKNAAIGGSIMVKDGNECFNRFYFYKPDGSFEYYNKRHLFRMANEHLHFSPGNSHTIVEFLGVRLFLMVCYDLRFPVWSRNTMQYDVVLLVANWPQVRIAAWEKLIAARAIENQSYIAAVNRVGVDGKQIPYNGSSRFVNYFGETVLESYDKDEIIYSSFDIQELKAFREKFPVSMDSDQFEII